MVCSPFEQASQDVAKGVPIAPLLLVLFGLLKAASASEGDALPRSSASQAAARRSSGPRAAR